jgi:type IV pilus assembly protein PilM
MLKLGAVWGVDIGDSAVKAVKLRLIGKQVVIQDFQIVRYSEIAGELGARRESYLPQAIVALQSAGLGREKCNVSIAPQSIFSRFISLPPVDKRRVPEIVLYEARQQIPFNLNEVIWAYESVRKEFIPGEEIEIGLFAVKREVMSAYLAELAPLWKQIQGIQVAPLGLYNFIRHEVPIEQPAVVLDIGAQSTDLLIIDGDKFWLRNLPIAGNSFSAVLEKRLNITHADAEKLKYQIADSRHRRKLLEVLRPVMRDLLAEVQRSVGYYKSLSQAVKFEEILVTGEGFKLFGLDRFLGEQLQYRITPIQELRSIVYQGDPARQKEFTESLPSLTTAVGLGLQSLGRGRSTINLLPEDFVLRRAMGHKRYSGLIAAGIVWAVVGSLFAKESRTLAAVKGMEGMGDSTIAKVSALDKQLADARKGDKPERLNFFQGFGKYREYYARVIGSVAAVVPREVQIDQFVISPAATVAAASAASVASGRVQSARDAALEQMLLGGDDDDGYSGGGPTVDLTPIQNARFVLTFTATVDASKEPVELQQRLPTQIRRATIYPEDVPLVENVVVGPLTRRERAIRVGDTNVAALTAMIYVDLLEPNQAEIERAEIVARRKEEARKAAEEAARKAKEAAAAGEAPATPPAAPSGNE